MKIRAFRTLLVITTGLKQPVTAQYAVPCIDGGGTSRIDLAASLNPKNKKEPVYRDIRTYIEKVPTDQSKGNQKP